MYSACLSTSSEERTPRSAGVTSVAAMWASFGQAQHGDQLLRSKGFGAQAMKLRQRHTHVLRVRVAMQRCCSSKAIEARAVCQGRTLIIKV